MTDLAARYCDAARPLRIVDVGSFDVNGSYREIFAKPSWRYVGVDIAAGPNVDVVLSSPYRFPFARGFADLVISGQAFEHIEYFWLTWREMVRVLRPAGLIFLIAPSRGPEHLHPVDCWRFLPGGYRALATYVNGIELVEVHTDWEPHPADDSKDWGDTVGVFRKQPQSAGLIRRIRTLFGHRDSRVTR
jgi:SAM-dependent methyltransferase